MIKISVNTSFCNQSNWFNTGTPSAKWHTNIYISWYHQTNNKKLNMNQYQLI